MEVNYKHLSLIEDKNINEKQLPKAIKDKIAGFNLNKAKFEKTEEEKFGLIAEKLSDELNEEIAEWLVQNPPPAPIDTKKIEEEAIKKYEAKKAAEAAETEAKRKAAEAKAAEEEAKRKEAEAKAEADRLAQEEEENKKRTAEEQAIAEAKRKEEEAQAAAEAEATAKREAEAQAAAIEEKKRKEAEANEPFNVLFPKG